MIFVYMLMHKRNKPRIPFRLLALQPSPTRSELRAARSQKVKPEREYGVRFREPVSSRDVSLRSFSALTFGRRFHRTRRRTSTPEHLLFAGTLEATQATSNGSFSRTLITGMPLTFD